MEYSMIIAAGLFSGGVWQIIGQSSLFGSIILAILLCFSLFSWGIMFNKWRLFRRVEREDHTFLAAFRKTKKLSGIMNQAKTLEFTPLAGIFINGYNEISEFVSSKQTTSEGSDKVDPLTDKEIEIIGMTLERSVAEEIGFLERRVIFLATTANASPFLGLLGTVVGVMDSFWSIGERGSASLAVVAPGIAEALLATIVGLGAAIPAVVAYNWASNKLKFYYDRSENFSLEFMTRIKKDMT
nr:MotA/TolQ/ExbB proton channel family protein [candidate division Zixibacteria bacterium]